MLQKIVSVGGFEEGAGRLETENTQLFCFSWPKSNPLLTKWQKTNVTVSQQHRQQECKYPILPRHAMQ